MSDTIFYADHANIPRGWYCKLPNGHEGPCPTYARWWKKLWVRYNLGFWP